MNFWVRLVAEGSGDCNQAFSNAVLLTFDPQISYQELVNPDATTITLYTTQSDPLNNAEIKNTSDQAQLDWNALPEKQLYNFLFDTLQKNPQYGRWQVSVLPFDADICKDPKGVIAYQDIDLTKVNPQQSAFKINFKEIALNKPSKQVLSADMNPLGDMAVSVQGALGFNKQANKDKTVEDELYDKYVKDKDLVRYYVRFVSLNPNDNGCDPTYKPSTPVTVDYGVPQKYEIKLPSTETHYVTVQSNAVFKIEKIQYVPVKFQTHTFAPDGHYIYTKSVFSDSFLNTGKLLHSAGDKVYIPKETVKEDKDLFDYVGEFIEKVGDFISAIGQIVNFVSSSYNNLKTGIVSGIADSL